MHTEDLRKSDHRRGGKPLPDLLVSALDRDRKYDDKLGAALSDEAGRHTINYYPREFRRGPEPGADLYVTLIDIKGQVLFTSEDAIRCNGGQCEVFDIQISA
jgi:hypothetical protein